MIKAKEGEITIKGDKVELLVDLATIIRVLKETFVESKETEESAKQQINDTIKAGLMNDEEFEKHKKKKMKEVAKTLFGELLGGLFDEDKGE